MDGAAQGLGEKYGDEADQLFDPKIDYIDWPHIEEEHVGEAVAEGKSKWTIGYDLIVWYINEVFCRNRKYLKREHIGGNDRSLWHRFGEDVGLDGNGNLAFVVQIYVSVRGTNGEECVVTTAFPR